MPTDNSTIPPRTAAEYLIYTYARNIRRGRGIDCVELFTGDGVFEIRDCPLDSDRVTVRARLEGREQIAAYLTRGDGAAARVCPVVGNLMVDIRGDTAVANSVMTATVLPGGKRLLGEYEDHLVFDGGWRFASRRFDILGEFD